MKRSVKISAVAALTVFLTACGGGGGDTAPTDTQPVVDPLQTNTVYIEIVEDISGNANDVSVTAAQLNTLDVISGAVNEVDYAVILAAGEYTDPNNPTIAEIQAVINASDYDNDGIVDINDPEPLIDEVQTYEYPTAKEAHDFLLQTTFGPTQKLIDEVVAKGVEDWVEYQLNLPSAYDNNNDTHLSYMQRLIELSKELSPGSYPATIYEYTAEDGPVLKGPHRELLHIWFEHAFHAEDQLRQRVAYGLSQIIVQAGDTHRDAHYYDAVVKHSLGNYRDLLIEVTHSPGMGLWLTYTSSYKASSTRAPDENYARELMQLFTIGLSELNMDGSPILDENGSTIPTYDQDDVVELSKVFTGWNVKGNKFGKISAAASDYTRPMQFYPDYHDFGAKNILNGMIPANLSGDADIEAAIDILMAQPSMAPFVSRQLIMRLVTSNPSPQYIERVATVFNDNGHGIKGDLKEVVRAILLDPEARGVNTPSYFGKVKEPVLAFIEMLRHLHVTNYPYPYITDEGTEVYSYKFDMGYNSTFGQRPLAADTVFNFYSPDYVPNDPSFSNQGLVAPEFEIITPQRMANFANIVFNTLARNHEGYLLDAEGNPFNNIQFEPKNEYMVSFKDELAVIKAALNGDYYNIRTNETQAVDSLMIHMNQKFTNGALSTAQMGTIKAHVKSFTYDRNIKGARYMISQMLRLVLASNAYMVQR